MCTVCENKIRRREKEFICEYKYNLKINTFVGLNLKRFFETQNNIFVIS